MKNLIKISFGFILISLIIINLNSFVFGADLTLTDIINKYKTSPIIDMATENGYTITFTEEANAIIMTGVKGEETFTNTYTLTGNILETTATDMSSALYAQHLLISVAELHGYSRNYISAILTLPEVLNYTVDNQGFSIEEENDICVVKINTHAMNLTANMDNIYIEPSDFESHEEYISGDGALQISKGYLVLNKSGYGDEVSFFIGEENELTDNAYKSILSVLEVMFGSKDVPNYFNSKYPSLSSGDAEFDGIKIEINPVKTSMENTVLENSDYKFVRVTINKATVSSALNLTTLTINSDTTIATITKIPQSGRVFEIIDLLKLILVSSMFVLISFSIYNRKKEKQTN